MTEAERAAKAAPYIKDLETTLGQPVTGVWQAGLGIKAKDKIAELEKKPAAELSFTEDKALTDLRRDLKFLQNLGVYNPEQRDPVTEAKAKKDLEAKVKGPINDLEKIVGRTGPAIKGEWTPDLEKAVLDKRAELEKKKNEASYADKKQYSTQITAIDDALEEVKNAKLYFPKGTKPVDPVTATEAEKREKADKAIAANADKARRGLEIFAAGDDRVQPPGKAGSMAATQHSLRGWLEVMRTELQIPSAGPNDPLWRYSPDMGKKIFEKTGPQTRKDLDDALREVGGYKGFIDSLDALHKAGRFAEWDKAYEDSLKSRPRAPKLTGAQQDIVEWVNDHTTAQSSTLMDRIMRNFTGGPGLQAFFPGEDISVRSDNQLPFNNDKEALKTAFRDFLASDKPVEAKAEFMAAITAMSYLPYGNINRRVAFITAVDDAITKGQNEWGGDPAKLEAAASVFSDAFAANTAEVTRKFGGAAPDTKTPILIDPTKHGFSVGFPAAPDDRRIDAQKIFDAYNEQTKNKDRLGFMAAPMFFKDKDGNSYIAGVEKVSNLFTFKKVDIAGIQAALDEAKQKGLIDDADSPDKVKRNRELLLEIEKKFPEYKFAMEVYGPTKFGRAEVFLDYAKKAKPLPELTESLKRDAAARGPAVERSPQPEAKAEPPKPKEFAITSGNREYNTGRIEALYNDQNKGKKPEDHKPLYFRDDNGQAWIAGKDVKGGSPDNFMIVPVTAPFDKFIKANMGNSKIFSTKGFLNYEWSNEKELLKDARDMEHKASKAKPLAMVAGDDNPRQKPLRDQFAAPARGDDSSQRNELVRLNTQKSNELEFKANLMIKPLVSVNGSQMEITYVDRARMDEFRREITNAGGDPQTLLKRMTMDEYFEKGLFRRKDITDEVEKYRAYVKDTDMMRKAPGRGQGYDFTRVDQEAAVRDRLGHGNLNSIMLAFPKLDEIVRKGGYGQYGGDGVYRQSGRDTVTLLREVEIQIRDIPSKMQQQQTRNAAPAFDMSKRGETPEKSGKKDKSDRSYEKVVDGKEPQDTRECDQKFREIAVAAGSTIVAPTIPNEVMAACNASPAVPHPR